MNRTLFIPAWFDDVCSVVHTLDFSLSTQFGAASQRLQLSRSRDKLHDLCLRMECDGEAECAELVYLALFDALSHITESLRHHPVTRAELMSAVAILRDLRNSFAV